jgi:hypothetical protein
MNANMTYKTVLVSSALSLLFSCKGREYDLSYSVFHHRNGWGYDILLHKKVFIHQEAMPALALDKGFDTEMQAIDAAKLVILKLEKREVPALSQREILGITSGKE